MVRKALLLAIAVSAAVAFSAPAAQGSITLYDPVALVHLQPGNAVSATSTDTEVTFAGGNTLHCEHYLLFGELTGTGETVEGFAGGATVSQCSVNGFIPVFISGTGAEFSFESSGTGTAGFGLAYSAPALGLEKCAVETNGVHAEWAEGTDVVQMAGGPLLGTGTGCPNEAEEVHGTFTVTHNGSSVIRT